MNSDLEKYMHACIANGVARECGNVKAGNKQADIIFTIYALLKESNRLEELMSLLSHENLYVRLWAATHCLQFPNSGAEEILCELARLKGSVVALSAHTSLFGWRNGMAKF